ncbi:anti-sigma factor family protein [Actinomadura kijaniata]|uniref:anti-sigma factor family protein n=1 Tax=Actinomadura kijaniata TaxID=46161 RepID=UPI003F195E4E
MNPAHIDYDTLADLAEGLLEDDQAASVNAHLDTCAECRERSADLADVSRILAEAPVPSMPADLASRIDSAIAAESLNNATVVSLEQRRGRRHWRILSAAAATVVVLGGGAVVGKAALDGARDEGQASATRTTPLLDGGEQQASPKGAVPSAPSGDQAEKTQRTFAAHAPSFGVARTGTHYRAATLGAQVNGLLGKGNEARLEPRRPDAKLAECVASVTGGKAPVLVDSATFEGSPATVVVLNGARPGQWDVWVVGPDCSPQDRNVLTHVTT